MLEVIGSVAPGLNLLRIRRGRPRARRERSWIAEDDRERAAAELGRLASLGRTHWYVEGSHPPDLRAWPPHLILKGDKERVERDWSNALFPANAVLVNPRAQYGTMADFLGPLTPGAYMGGIDLQD